ncbi:MAG: M24 family metallopeptidase [Aestuariivirgaceae bacterium]
MSLHFPADEFQARQRAVCVSLAAQGFYGLVLFRQESMYYLTGYDTSGYTMFQGMYIGADGRLALLTRSADRLQSSMTSLIEDIRIWVDRDDASPGEDLRDMLADYGCKGERLALEYHAYGLTAQRGKMVDAALDGFCETEDGSDIVRLLRLVKSPAELEFVRKAGALCDEAWAIANRQTVPGAFLGDVYGQMMHAIVAGDGDPSASRWPMGAGENAMMVRYHTGKETVAAQDQVTHEFAAAYRHYHACAMSCVVTGTAPPVQHAMFTAARDALLACKAALRPGNTVGDAFDAHTSTLETAGFGHAALNACGYSLGIAYPPTWMDWPMIWKDNPQNIESSMVFFVHIILLDDRSGLSMSLGETGIVTASGFEEVTHAPDELVVNGT